MITALRSEDRGSADFGWLQSRHSFSFGHYYNPQQMGFGNLRVINEDRVLPGKGFGTHGHKDMEIISYVISGALEHRDSMGNGSITQAGDVQRMSAGTGIRHSEFNPSSSEPVHFLQIWILPERTGTAPGYQQLHFSEQQKTNCLCLVASPDGRNGSLGMQQEADIYACLLKQGRSVSHACAAGRKCWIQIVRGSLHIKGMTLSSGDAAAVEGEESLEIVAGENAEFLLFDLG